MNKNVIVLSRTVKEKDFAKTRKLFSIWPQRHRVIWAEDLSTGLMKMSIYIAWVIFRNLIIEGFVLGERTLRTLIVTITNARPKTKSGTTKKNRKSRAWSLVITRRTR